MSNANLKAKIAAAARSAVVGLVVGMAGWLAFALPAAVAGDPAEPTPSLPKCTHKAKACVTYGTRRHQADTFAGNDPILCKRCVQDNNASTYESSTEEFWQVTNGSGKCGKQKRTSYSGVRTEPENEFNPANCGTDWRYFGPCGGDASAPCGIALS